MDCNLIEAFGLGFNIYSMAYIGQGKAIAGGSMGRISIIDRKTNVLPVLHKVDSAVFSMHYVASSQVVILGTQSGKLYKLDLLSNKLDLIDNLGYTLFSIASDERYLYIGNKNGELTILDKINYRRIAIQKIGHTAIRKIISNGFNQLLLSSSNGDVLLRIETGEVLELYKAEKSIFSICIDYKNGKFLFGGMDAMLYGLDMESRGLVSKIPAHLATINDLMILENSNYLVSAARDKTIKIWDAKTLALCKVLEASKMKMHTASVNCIINMCDMDSFISGSDDGSLFLWQINN